MDGVQIRDRYCPGSKKDAFYLSITLADSRSKLMQRPQAILLAKDLLLEEDVSAETILPGLLTWLDQEEGKAR